MLHVVTVLLEYLIDCCINLVFVVVVFLLGGRGGGGGGDLFRYSWCTKQFV